MAVNSGLFNSVNGDRKYNAFWFAQYFASFIGNGVFPNPSTGLQVVESTNMQTVVKAGKGWINGYYIVNDADYILQHNIADGVLKRIDRVIIRLNFLTRTIEIAIKKGTVASSPVAPTLQRDTDYHELALADVFIANGTTQIKQANITDLRLNKSLCGIVHGTVDQVDTTTIFNQYQSWFNTMQATKSVEFDAWMGAEQADFETWFASIQTILDGNVAANIQNQIDLLDVRVDTAETNLTTHKTEDAPDAHNATSISVADTANKFTATNVETALLELFTFANNGKTDIASVIGSPATNGDTFAQLKAHIQNPKNTIASPLGVANTSTLATLASTLETRKNSIATAVNTKGVPATSADTLAALATKIDQISTGKKFASGSVTSITGPAVVVSGLTFTPSLIFITRNTLAWTNDSTVFSRSRDANNYIRIAATNTLYPVTQAGGYVDGTGFKLLVVNPSVEYTWVAYE